MKEVIGKMASFVEFGTLGSEWSRTALIYRHGPINQLFAIFEVFARLALGSVGENISAIRQQYGSLLGAIEILEQSDLRSVTVVAG